MSRKTKWMALVGVGLLAGLVVFMSAGGFAVNPTSVGVTVTVAPTIQLAMTNTPVAYGSLAPVDPPVADTSKTMGVSVNSNKAWALAVKTDGLLTAPGPLTIPTGNFNYKAQNAGAGVTIVVGAYTPFTTLDVTLATGVRGAGLTLDVNYSLLIDWGVEPGNYVAAHTYTVTQP